MTRYYLEVRYRVAPVDAVDEHTDAMMDALSVEPHLIDADVTQSMGEPLTVMLPRTPVHDNPVPKT